MHHDTTVTSLPKTIAEIQARTRVTGESLNTIKCPSNLVLQTNYGDEICNLSAVELLVLCFKMSAGHCRRTSFLAPSLSSSRPTICLLQVKVARQRLEMGQMERAREAARLEAAQTALKAAEEAAVANMHSAEQVLEAVLAEQAEGI